MKYGLQGLTGCTTVLMTAGPASESVITCLDWASQHKSNGTYHYQYDFESNTIAWEFSNPHDATLFALIKK